MVSEVEPVAKNATGSCFAKVHDVFTSTYSAYSKTDADSPFSAAANNNTKAFSSFKTPSEVPIAPGVGGYARWPQSSPIVLHTTRDHLLSRFVAFGNFVFGSAVVSSNTISGVTKAEKM